MITFRHKVKYIFIFSQQKVADQNLICLPINIHVYSYSVLRI